MLSRITLANREGTDIVLHEDSNTSKRLAINAQGLIGVGALRVAKRVKATAHGGINETSFEDGRSIKLDLELVSPTSIEDVLEQFRLVVQPMLETLDYGPALLKWTEASTGLKKQMLVKLDSEVEPILSEAAARLTFPVMFFATDPRAYSQTQTTETGATVTYGPAEPEWIKSGATVFSFGIAVDATHIYFANEGAIGRATLAGGSIEPHWITSAQTGQVTDLTVDSEHIYWTNANGVGRATIAGASIEKEWIVSSQGASAIAVDASHVYFRRAGWLCRATITGGSLEREWCGPLEHANAVSGLAVDSGHIYWCEPNSIGRATIAGASIEREWIKGASEPKGVEVSATFVYWGNSTGNTIGRAKLNGSEVVQNFITLGEGFTPGCVTVNSEKVYWNDTHKGYVGRSPLAGSVPAGSITIAQAGNRQTPITLKIHGPITNPAIVRSSDGASISLSGTVTSGNYLEIDTANRTIKLNGATNALSMVNAARTDWSAFVAPPNPASETYSLTGTTATAAFMEAIYRAAYA